jgi:hypothetical protein
MQCVMRAIIKLIEMEVQDGYSICHKKVEREYGDES